jgi:protein NrfD
VVLFLFLAHLGLGIVFTLVFVPREAGVKFFRFNAGLAAILLVVALGFLFRSLPAWNGIGGANVGFLTLALGTVALVASTIAIVLYWATVGRVLAKIRPALVAVAIGAGFLAIVLQGASIDDGIGMQLLTVASFLSSAALLGGACTAMILGHWYLVIPSMQVSYLQSIVKLHIASMAVRVAVVAAAVSYALMPSFSIEAGMASSFRHYITSIDGIFFWQRVLFGLGGPALLSYLTWETAKIRSTQSATGILYVDFFTVVVGEVLAKYILLATRVPV